MSHTALDEKRSAYLAVTVFPVAILCAGLFGMWLPEIAAPLNPYVIYLLGIVMFTMGLTLTADDIKGVARMPFAVAVGCAAQFAVMPLLGWLTALALGLPDLLVIGMVLLGAAPGGASSNIVAYLARGNVALSITMTSVSTLLAPVLTPLLVWLLAGKYLPVDFAAMFKQVMQMVLLPVLLGMTARYLLRRHVHRFLPYVPWISMLVLSVLIAGIMSKTGAALQGTLLPVFAAVLLHNAFGFLLGYLAARYAKLGNKERRAVAIEVGMQNAGLAAALAHANYAALAALPAAVATIWHNIAGAVLAFLFNFLEQRAQRKP